ncbi:hypothetical protein [Corynebacterium sp. TAE3-ERU30]|uniref:arsenate reductase/protein-tyrosine-phosphatase family protein n=1 Tax=Corynebacterium sp. TAE3-ERU30 TaxID=2849496 RepID=UPI001C456B58|nr:hypothetical protein [Corynebacterium sp. TAE3-ERU30]MBV7281197.1 hypothetical protein [Corynebacterium sp. TAE3-ERU30]
MTLKILTVCTGNICRSPYIEYRLAHAAAAAGLEVQVDSAGTQATNGTPYHPHTLSLLEKQGIDASQGSSRYLTAAIARDYDLIIAAAEDHIPAIARTAPAAWRSCITLRHLASLNPEEIRPGTPIMGQAETKRVAQNASAGSFSISDPIGQPLAAFETMAASVDAALPHALRVIEKLAAEE